MGGRDPVVLWRWLRTMWVGYVRCRQRLGLQWVDETDTTATTTPATTPATAPEVPPPEPPRATVQYPHLATPSLPPATSPTGVSLAPTPAATPSPAAMPTPSLPPSAPPGKGDTDIVTQLKLVSHMAAEGLLSPSEFAAAKQAILQRPVDDTLSKTVPVSSPPRAHDTPPAPAPPPHNDTDVLPPGDCFTGQSADVPGVPPGVPPAETEETIQPMPSHYSAATSTTHITSLPSAPSGHLLPESLPGRSPLSEAAQHILTLFDSVRSSVQLPAQTRSASVALQHQNTNHELHQQHPNLPQHPQDHLQQLPQQLLQLPYGNPQDQQEHLRQHHPPHDPQPLQQPQQQQRPPHLPVHPQDHRKQQQQQQQQHPFLQPPQDQQDHLRKHQPHPHLQLPQDPQQLLQQQQYPPQAQQHLQQPLQHHPQSDDPLHGLGLSAEQREQIVLLLRQALQNPPPQQHQQQPQQGYQAPTSQQSLLSFIGTDVPEDVRQAIYEAQLSPARSPARSSTWCPSASLQGQTFPPASLPPPPALPPVLPPQRGLHVAQPAPVVLTALPCTTYPSPAPQPGDPVYSPTQEDPIRAVELYLRDSRHPSASDTSSLGPQRSIKTPGGTRADHLQKGLRCALRSIDQAGNALEIAEALHIVDPDALASVLHDFVPSVPKGELRETWRGYIKNYQDQARRLLQQRQQQQQQQPAPPSPMTRESSPESALWGVPATPTPVPAFVPSLAGKGPFAPRSGLCDQRTFRKNVSPPRRAVCDPAAELRELLARAARSGQPTEGDRGPRDMAAELSKLPKAAELLKPPSSQGRDPDAMHHANLVAQLEHLHRSC
eukprot:Sspe_Gene.32790::Locus_16057_Transcript_1_1_Confidence_1.000_Length_2561::g.32790::m.32790